MILMQLDVFTLVPHAFAWLTEQRPVATVLGDELDLRLFSYRDTTPLRNGQVDDEPVRRRRGMVLRVDVVAAALDAAYGGPPTHRVIALTPQGPPADAGSRRGACDAGARDASLGPLRRLRRADRRAPRTDAISIGPYVLSNGDLPAMVLVDAIARRLPGRARGGLGRGRERSPPSSAEDSSTRTTRAPPEFRGWRVPDVLLSGDHGRDRSAGGRSRCVEEPDRPPDRGAAARLAGHDRLARHDPRRDRDRARDQAVGHQPVPHPVELDGADAPLRAARTRAARRSLLRPRARLPLLLPLLVAASAATSSSSTRRRRPRSPAARAASS